MKPGIATFPRCLPVPQFPTKATASTALGLWPSMAIPPDAKASLAATPSIFVHRKGFFQCQIGGTGLFDQYVQETRRRRLGRS